MFFKFYHFLGTYPTWGMGDWLVMVGLALGAVLLARYATTLLRVLLTPLVALELFMLTPFFACKAAPYMFTRVQGTNFACTSGEYANYVSANFGLGHWWMVATYFLVFAFMTFNFWKAIALQMGWRPSLTAGQKAALADQKALEATSLERIRDVGSIRRIGE